MNFSLVGDYVCFFRCIKSLLLRQFRVKTMKNFSLGLYLRNLVYISLDKYNGCSNPLYFIYFLLFTSKTSVSKSVTIDFLKENWNHKNYINRQILSPFFKNNQNNGSFHTSWKNNIQFKEVVRTDTTIWYCRYLKLIKFYQVKTCSFKPYQQRIWIISWVWLQKLPKSIWKTLKP